MRDVGRGTGARRPRRYGPGRRRRRGALRTRPAGVRLGLELGAPFLLAPAGLALVPGPVVLPAVLVGGLGCLLFLLRDPTFDRAQLGAAGARAWLRPALLVTAAAARALALVAYAALAFACAHLVLRNVPAIALSFLGGLLFARTYERSRSLLLPALQQALLGDVAFTVGFADLLYDGARATAGPLRF